MESRELLTAKQAADLLGVSKQTLAVWRCEGRYDLRYVKVGACVRYRRSDLEKFLEQRTLGGTGESTGAGRSRS